MSLYKRGDVWHYDFTVYGERYRGSTGLRAKTAAARVEDRERERAVLGEISRPVPRFKDAADQWFQARGCDLKSAVTIAQRLRIANRLLGADTPVNEIGSREMEAAILARRVEITKRGRLPTNATVNRDLIGVARPVLQYARKVMESPVKAIDWDDLRLKEPAGRSRSFSEDEMNRWRGDLPEWHRPVWDFIARYGVRLAEAFFPIDNFDAATGEVRLRDRKNGLPHVVALLEADAADMAARIGRARAAGLPTAWFKESADGIEQIHWRGFEAASRAALDRANIADARPVHDLRHHAATTLLRSPNSNLGVVQRLLGHENVGSTMRYAHVEVADVKNALRHAYGTAAAAIPEKPTKSKAG